MDTSPTTAALNDPKPKRRWLTFSLMGLLGFVTVAAVALGWAVHEARKQGVAARAIEKAGGSVAYGKSGRPPNALERLRMLLGEKEAMDAVSAYVGPRDSDDAMADIRGLPHLEILILSESKVTDAGLVHLQGLTKLIVLDLTKTEITGDGVRKLRKALPHCYIER